MHYAQNRSFDNIHKREFKVLRIQGVLATPRIQKIQGLKLRAKTDEHTVGDPIVTEIVEDRAPLAAAPKETRNLETASAEPNCGANDIFISFQPFWN